MRRNFFLLAGSSNPQLSDKMSKVLGQVLMSRKAKPFSSGEPYVEEVYGNVRRQHVVILQSGMELDRFFRHY